MPLNEPRMIERFRRESALASFVTALQVPLPPGHFATHEARGADILFKRRADTGGYLLIIDAGVRYVGNNQTYQELFAVPADRGWRVLAGISSDDPELVLAQADSILGLAGRPPGMPVRRDGRPELIVRTEELTAAPERGADEPGERFGVDLVDEARAGRLTAPLFRDRETDALVRIVSKAGKNAACLVGAPGVGKTAVVEGLAVRIARNDVPKALAETRILDVNLSFLAAGATYKNEFEGRIKALLDLARTDRDVILFLDELHTIRGPASDASQMVKSDLGRGRIRCIGATTNSEYRLLESDAALTRRFQVIPVQELTPTQWVNILRAARPRLEGHHRVSISDELLQSVVDLSCRYVPDRQLPDKALDLLDEACACARLGAREESHERRNA